MSKVISLSRRVMILPTTNAMSVSESEEDSHSGCAGQEDGVSGTDVLGMVSYQLGTLATR